MIYDVVNQIFEVYDFKMCEKYVDLVDMFDMMGDLYCILYKYWWYCGVIDFDDNEVKIIVDEVGYLIDI